MAPNTISEPPFLLDTLAPTPWSAGVALPAPRREFLSQLTSGFYVFMGDMCDQNCAYCYMYKNRYVAPLARLERQLEVAWRLGFRNPKLNGGEPLAHPRLHEALDLVRARGFEAFGLYSNGAGLADTARLERLVARGLRFVHLSLDSPRPEVQDALCRRPGLLALVEQALTHLGRHPEVYVALGAVVTRANWGHLEELVEWVAGLRARAGLRATLVLHQYKPYGQADPGLVAPYTQAAEAMDAAIRAGERLGVPVFHHDAPWCRLPQPELYSVDWHVRLVTLDKAGHDVTEAPSTRLRPDRGRTERCRACPWDATCPGFLKSYAAVMGDHDFRPPEVDGGLNSAR